jgi:hypothetical protein
MSCENGASSSVDDSTIRQKLPDRTEQSLRDIADDTNRYAIQIKGLKGFLDTHDYYIHEL